LGEAGDSSDVNKLESRVDKTFFFLCQCRSK
jgi:hypothetical protein